MPDYAEIDLTGAYKKYTEDVSRKIQAAERKIGRKMLDDVVNTSPVEKESTAKHRAGYQPRRTPGQYRKGWKLRTLSRSSTRYVLGVVNQTDSPLGHLIDLGHKMPRGGNYSGTKHISKAQAKANEELKKDIKNILDE